MLILRASARRSSSWCLAAAQCPPCAGSTISSTSSTGQCHPVIIILLYHHHLQRDPRLGPQPAVHHPQRVHCDGSDVQRQALERQDLPGDIITFYNPASFAASIPISKSSFSPLPPTQSRLSAGELEPALIFFNVRKSWDSIITKLR